MRGRDLTSDYNRLMKSKLFVFLSAIFACGLCAYAQDRLQWTYITSLPTGWSNWWTTGTAEGAASLWIAMGRNHKQRWEVENKDELIGSGKYFQILWLNRNGEPLYEYGRVLTNSVGDSGFEEPSMEPLWVDGERAVIYVRSANSSTQKALELRRGTNGVVETEFEIVGSGRPENTFHLVDAGGLFTFQATGSSFQIRRYRFEGQVSSPTLLIRRNEGAVEVSWESRANQAYYVEVSDDLMAWKRVGGSLMGTGGRLKHTDEATASRKFVRVSTER